MTPFPWAGLSTEIALCALGVGLFVVDTFITDPKRKHWLGYLAFGGLLLCLVPASGVCADNSTPTALFGGLYLTDGFHLFFRMFAVLVGALTVLLSMEYLEHIRLDRGLYFVLLVFTTLAVVLVAGAGDLLMIYLSIEFLSIGSYVLAAFLLGRDKSALSEVKKSNEASLKYLIYGSVSSGVMLYGFSLLYGLAGSTGLAEVAKAVADPSNQLLKTLALLFALGGLAFKISAVPFHQWTPDVYEGAPTPVVAFLATASKAAAFAVLARLLVIGLGGWHEQWAALVSVIAVATMFIGNLLALLQGNIKRMLAYSSVAHAGYLLVALIVSGADGAGLQALLIYLSVYLFMTIGAFAVVVYEQRNTGSEQIESYAGLAERSPLVAASMLIFMLSLTGIPPTAGFIGKLFILKAAVADPGYWWLGLCIIVNSVISAFYYMNVVRVMYFHRPSAEVQQRPALTSLVVLGVCAVATILLGLQFGFLVDLTHGPMSAVLGG